ncbi:hypothetical protein HK100_008252 [Physocladia obscura]|uniref:Ricin B lectin domain-containing protein n=1 Tax=Physocladia obscura TaxID=109957 RepID=A0AAD5SPB0_9FUNG|nr:hypothetical protein HK100_008252 [Physocladia obscura]
MPAVVSVVFWFVAIAGHRTHGFTTVFRNGELLYDTSQNRIQAHGAGAIKVGATYYWIGENRNGDNTFRHVSAYRSTDLVNWDFANDILSQSSAPELAVANIERPKVIYNDEINQFVLWMHWENGVDYSQARTAVAVSDTVDGNYTYLGSFRPLGYDSRDMTVFVDDDANKTAYLFSATNDNADLNVYELTPDYTNVTRVVTTLWEGSYREAPGIVKRNGVYVCITSQSTNWTPNLQKYATATSINGPWGNLTSLSDNDSITHGSQNAFLLPLSDNASSVLYMGDRWAGAWSQPVSDSEYVWLPLVFTSDTQLSLPWYPALSFNISAATITGVAEGVGSAAAYFSLEPLFSGKCIDVPGQSLANGTAVIQYTCNDGANQQYQILQVPDNTNEYVIIARHSHLCLALQSATAANGILVEQQVCNFSDTTQLWQFDAVSGVSSGFTVVSVFAGKCLDVTGYSTANSVAIELYDCNGGQNQQLILVGV